MLTSSAKPLDYLMTRLLDIESRMREGDVDRSINLLSDRVA
jgi:hypothetical protein